MDKETEKRLTALETDMNTVKTEIQSWKTLIKDAIMNVVLWLLKAGITGALLGWMLPESVRHALIEWASK